MKRFRSYDRFKEFTGMIHDDDLLIKLGLNPDQECGYFEIDRLKELQDFCDKNPEYHIITETSDCDDYDLDKYFVTTIENGVRFVNRMHFYIGNGSKDNAFLVEKRKRDE